MRPLLVLPTYQEGANIGLVLEAVRAAAPDVSVLVVDDGSPDGTAERAEQIGARMGGVAVLRRARKAGLGSAYRDGFAWGLHHGFDVLLEMDADLSHDPADIPGLLRSIEAGANLAVGSRYVPGGAIPDWPVHRRLLSRWGNRYAAWALGLAVADSTSGFRAYRADVLAEIGYDTCRAGGYGFQIEMTHRVAQAGGTIVEVPIAFRDRIRGTSKMSGRIVVEALLLVTAWGVRQRLRRSRRHLPDRPAEQASSGVVGPGLTRRSV